MAAASAVEIPTIFFDKSDRFANLHGMRLPGVRGFVNLTDVSMQWICVILCGRTMSYLRVAVAASAAAWYSPA